MEKGLKILIGLLFVIVLVLPIYANDVDLAKKIDAVLSKGPEDGNYFVSADDVYMWLKMKKTDFVVVDVRLKQYGGFDEYQKAHIPGAIYIPYDVIAKPENLKKLPKDKKIILVCFTGVTETLPIVPLRLLGYETYGMLLGMAGWQKDYPQAESVRALLDAPKIKNYPLEKGK